MTLDVKHTPGPWNAATSASSIVGWPVVSQKGRPICDILGVPKGFPNEEKHNAEALANARLISAAPELLKDAEDALDALQQIGEEHLLKILGDGWGICQLIADMQKNIAKAKGAA